MSEIQLTKMRRAILETCQTHHGTLERKWDADPIARKAIQFLVAQKLLRREVGDDHRAFASKLITTERGVKALNGDILHTL